MNRKSRMVTMILIVWGTISLSSAAEPTRAGKAPDSAPLALTSPRVAGQLFLGQGERQPLMVGFGGAEGGNAWAGPGWKKVRDQFVAKGYAFLALAYFGAPGTPPALDRLALEDIHRAIAEAARTPRVDGQRIGLVGGSMGAQLALVLASRYPDIGCVVALVPSHVVFTNHTPPYDHSCWTFEGRELPFVPINEEAVRRMGQEDYRSAHEAVLKERSSVEKARIPVERIHGPILIVSARKDEMWPSTEMAEQMVAGLKARRFRYPCQHIAVEGGPGDSLKEFPQVFAFLAAHFPAGQ